MRGAMFYRLSFGKNVCFFALSCLAASLCNPLRHRVVTASSPRVTTQYAANGEVKSFDGAIFLQRFDGVLRTSGSEAACRRRKRGDASLIKSDGSDEQTRKKFFHDSKSMRSPMLLSLL